MITQALKCRSCGGALSEVFNLGNQYIATHFIKDGEELPTTQKFPLSLEECVDPCCGLVQLSHTVHPDLLFRKYWYRSGTNQSMVKALREIAEESVSMVGMGEGDNVIDIGSNDGTLLSHFRDLTPARLIGYEPSQMALEPGFYPADATVVNDYFTYHRLGEKARLITAIAMLYDLDNPRSFLKGISAALDLRGLLCIQLSYLPLMMKQVAFDNVLHEHLLYFSLKSLMYLLEREEMCVIHASLNDTNGGSIRVYAAHTQSHWSVDETVSKILWNEPPRYDFISFNLNVMDRIGRIKEFLIDCQLKGKIVDIIGASTKGNVFLQAAGIHGGLIRFIEDANPQKEGARTIETGIPIFTEKEDRTIDQPDVKLVLPWHFLPGLVAKNQEFLEGGGEIVVALPDFMKINKYNQEGELQRFQDLLCL